MCVEARGRADADGFSANVAKLRKREGEREENISESGSSCLHT